MQVKGETRRYRRRVCNPSARGCLLTHKTDHVIDSVAAGTSSSTQSGERSIATVTSTGTAVPPGARRPTHVTRDEPSYAARYRTAGGPVGGGGGGAVHYVDHEFGD